MRFLVDECTGPIVAKWLRAHGHDVFSVYESAHGMADEEILRKAQAETWIVVTNDKDFGEKIFREGRAHLWCNTTASS
jgi:predicted nuclease of predicted toxin-antitoxin system